MTEESSEQRRWQMVRDYSKAISFQQNLQHEMSSALDELRKVVEYLAVECGIDEDPDIDKRRIDDAINEADRVLIDLSSTFVTGTGQVIRNVHSKLSCINDDCVIHNPSIHHMVSWPTHFRSDRKIMERICVHGVAHPDPDDLYTKMPDGGIHGCCEDGCCSHETDWARKQRLELEYPDRAGWDTEL